MGKGVPTPSRIRSLGNVVCSPSSVRGGALTENEFDYSNDGDDSLMPMILRCVFYTRRLNKKVSYRKQIARQHSCRKITWPGQVAWLTV